MPNFTAHQHPALAVGCPTCGKAPDEWCCGANGQLSPDLHRARQAEADREFVEQYGDLAAIVPAAIGWLIDPHGRERD